MYKRHCHYVLLALGVTLIVINIIGAIKEVRSPILDRLDPSKALLAYDDALLQLEALEDSDAIHYVKNVNNIFHHAVHHVDWEGFSKTEIIESYSAVPIWENYILYFISAVLGRSGDVYEFTDYRRVLERGIGQCGQTSMALVDYLSGKGFMTGIVHLDGHVVATVEVKKGRWFVVDPDFGVTLPNSLSELENNLYIVDEYYKEFPEYNMRKYFSSKDNNEIIYGGAEARYPKAYYVEQLSYLFVWIIPLVIIGVYIYILALKKKL